MGVFDSLFGGKQPGTPERSKTSDTAPEGSTGPRPVRCDVCERESPVRFDGSFPMISLFGDLAREPPAGSIAACESCDIDVCSTCSPWKALAKPEIFNPVCPRCGTALQSKSQVDLFHRLPQLLSALDSSGGLRRARHAERLLRVIQDEEPLLAQRMGQEWVASMRKRLGAIPGSKGEVYRGI